MGTSEEKDRLIANIKGNLGKISCDDIIARAKVMRSFAALRMTAGDATSAGLRRYRAVLRLLLFLVMLLAPDFSDSDAPSTSPEALQPAFASASM